MTTKKVLVLAPHPDDDILGCGGRIIQHVAAGQLVEIAYLTSGESGSTSYSKSELAELRRAEATKAAKIMGVPAGQLHFLGWPDGYLAVEPDRLVAMTELIRQVQPTMVYLPHAADGHRDHQAAHVLGTEAINRADGHWFQETQGDPWRVSTVLAYEVWTPMSQFQVLADITDQMDQKLAALAAHASQLKDVAYDQAIEGLNHYRGATGQQSKYAEVFQVLRSDQLAQV